MNYRYTFAVTSIRFVSILGLALAGHCMAQFPLAMPVGDMGEQDILQHQLPWSDPAQLGGLPPNDNCADATVELLAAGGSVTRFGDNTGATDEFGFGNSVYEAFSITECMTVTVSYCGTTPTFIGAFTFLFKNCPLTHVVFIADENISTSLCGDGNFSLTFPLLPPGTYYYGVHMIEGATGPYQLTFTAEACTALPPANNECEGAVALDPSPVCNPLTVDVFGSTVSAGTLPPIDCGQGEGDAADDVWFRFVATATEHTVVVNASSGYNVSLDVRTGTCAGSTTIACADAGPWTWVPEQTVEVTGLSIGNTYYVRVYDWRGGMPATTTFDICVLGPSAQVCDAGAGTLSTSNSEVCYVVDGVSLTATPNGNMVVPADYDVLYILTEGNDLVIFDLAPDPVFEVMSMGNYRIHTLIYDPATLNLSFVEVFTTTAAEVNALLVQGGGQICGSLDVTGASIAVVECTGIGSQEEAFGSLVVFPNPGNGDLTVLLPAHVANAHVRLLDMTGRVVMTERVAVQGGNLILSWAGHVVPGSYLLQLVSPTRTWQQRLVLR